MRQYRENIQRLFQTFRRVLHRKTLVIWTTALPVSQSVRGGVILEEIRFLSEVLRYDVLLANDHTSRVAAHYGYDVLDLHYIMRRYIPWRLADGIHWNSAAHRKISGLLLHHICQAWKVDLPVRISFSYDANLPTSSGSYTGYHHVNSSQSQSDKEADSAQEDSSPEEQRSADHSGSSCQVSDREIEEGEVTADTD